ncbi:MAG: cation-transporting P-type ATPase, partial [Gemmatimonadaceae bacterium]
MSRRPEKRYAPAVNYHALSAAAVLQRTNSGRAGLSDAEAAQRLKQYGPNALRATPPASPWRVLLDQLRSVVVLLLVVAAAVSAVVRDVPEAIAIGAVLVINTLVGFVTELRARRAMEALLRLDAPSAVVIRDGRAREIDARELVPGDVVLLESGQSVAADARILEATDLRTIEAPLTGESLPVSKNALPVAEDTTLPDRTNMLYKGTTVAAGSARAVVVSTGMQTELGRIGGL